MAVKSICGTILVSENPEALVRFYGEALGLAFEREEHGGLAPHWGVDIGSVHFGIHPPENFKRSAAGQGSVDLTLDVTSLPEVQARLERLGAPCVRPPHDEGFGMVASLEIVELTYRFETGGV